MIWIEKGAGWHLAVQEEISHANVNNNLKEESSGQTTTKTETKTNNCVYKTGDKVYVLYRYSSIFGMKVTDRICGVVIAVDVDDKCYYQVLIQSIYDGSFKDPKYAKTRTDDRMHSVGDASWFGAGIVYRDY